MMLGEGVVQTACRGGNGNHIYQVEEKFECSGGAMFFGMVAPAHFKFANHCLCRDLVDFLP